MSELIPWNKLKLYKTDQKKSFEQLCYQLAIEEFGELGKFTPIDDSGGGDGVEFFLTLPNGEVWGWQAKYFDRLNKGGRKGQIKKSLQTAHKNHPKLKKWFLCNISDFTSEERNWFQKDLESSFLGGNKVLPEGHGVKLEHWGESELLNLLRKYPSIHNYFFEGYLFSWNWFYDRYERALETSQLKQKYESLLHITTDADRQVAKILGGKDLVNILRKEMDNNQVKMYAEEYKYALEKLQSDTVFSDYSTIQVVLRDFTRDKFSILEEGEKRLMDFEEAILYHDFEKFKKCQEQFISYLKTVEKYQKDYREISESELCSELKYIRWNPPAKEKKKPENIFNRISLFLRKKMGKSLERSDHDDLEKEEPKEVSIENRKRVKARQLLFGPLYVLGEYGISSLKNSFAALDVFAQQELHISGEAGMGKTHVSFNIFEKRIKSSQPAIFLFAKDFKSKSSISKQIRENINLDLPPSLNIEDFLAALNIAGRIYQTQVPIIVDGLNESLHWNQIWEEDLENLIILIKQKFPYLVLITTYRTSYEDKLFHKNYFKYESEGWKKKAYVNGFEGLTWRAIDKYFDFFKIKLLDRSDAIAEFEHPLYLKLFCQTKNPKRENVMEVSFQNEDLFEVFEEYLKSCSGRILDQLGKDPMYNKFYLEEKLSFLARHTWDNNSRGILRNENLFSDDELQIFEGENLLVYRDWGQDGEIISFTYDLLAGYLIAKYLIENPPKNNLRLLWKLLRSKITATELFIRSKNFNRRLLKDEHRHPLFNDILRCFSVLCIKNKKLFLFQVRRDEETHKYGLEALFEINRKYIIENQSAIKSYLKKRFAANKSRRQLFDLATSIELDSQHPLNFNFLSTLLTMLPMAERDLFWSEYIRTSDRTYKDSYFSDFVEDFYKTCKDSRPSGERIHLGALKIMWVLTTNKRKLRDEATRALYWYGRRFPKGFFNLLELSFNVNDPYVNERVLAAMYGIAMARQNDLDDLTFREEFLPVYAKKVFNKIFALNAEYATTHLWVREYARRTIEIALIHHPSLFSEEEKNLIFRIGHKNMILKWGESDEKKSKNPENEAPPIRMDFRNYTIGRLVQGRRNYQEDHDDYQRVLRGIYWRIYDLGYSIGKFGKIDSHIERINWNASQEIKTEHSKVDRYGKKYSWIAFYEMAGYRYDLGLLEDWDDKKEFRISDIDIDPSFPEKTKEHDLVKEKGGINILGDLKKPALEWYETQDDINFSDFLCTKVSLDEKRKDWVLLKGVISQRDDKNQFRETHAIINTIIISKETKEKILQINEEYSDIKFNLIHAVNRYYTFQGEIPWCSLIPNDYEQDFSVRFDFDNSRGENKQEKTFSIETTIFEGMWESYHSDINPQDPSDTPSKLIANKLGLFMKPQTSDMIDRDGDLASMAFRFGQRYRDFTEFVYIRKDLIQKYLQQTNQEILHIQWAEKKNFPDGGKITSSTTERDKRVFKTHSYIYPPIL